MKPSELRKRREAGKPPRPKSVLEAKGARLLSLMLLGFAALTLGVRACSNSSARALPTESWAESDSTTMAYYMACEFVREKLKAPASAEFPTGDRREHTERLKDQKYRIQSYVDAQNDFGAMLRQEFTADVQQTSEDYWTLVSLDM